MAATHSCWAPAVMRGRGNCDVVGLRPLNMDIWMRMTNSTCPVCSSNLSAGVQSWHYKCRACLYEKSNLQPSINETSSHKLVNEPEREAGLREIRMGNFRQLLREIVLLKPSGGTLVDVGCAHGWFLEAAKTQFNVLGIEPDEAVFNVTAGKGLPVRKGYFPDALEAGEAFDVIVFNDVVEHIPKIEEVLKACHERLNGDGLLVLNLPSSDGIFYQISRIFTKVGKFSFFERLWQKGLPSPHVHYFNAKNISELLTKSGFVTIKSGTLPTLGLHGLYTRISNAGKISIASRIFIYCVVAASLPILRLLPSDIVYVIGRKA